MKYISFLLAISMLFISCGKDADDEVKPEDVQNINFDEGFTFGEINLNCETNCVNGYKLSNGGLFIADTSGYTKENPEIATFFECPTSEESRFVSRADNIKNIPGSLRDVSNSNRLEVLNNSGVQIVYFLEYVVSGERKTIHFFNSINTNKQVGEYYELLIGVINKLKELNAQPVSSCNN